ncbi:MAG: FHA domain-containing protein [Actinobacteria bacterium]|nr:FHA domain-containing protein [Actinomycetota bacterium]
MKFKLTAVGRTEHRDVVVDTEPQATISAIAARLAERTDARVAGSPVGPAPTRHDGTQTLVVYRGHEQMVLRPDEEVATAAIRSGDFVAVAPADVYRPNQSDRAATVRILNGPDAGKEIHLQRGVATVGRAPDCTVVLSDGMVSKHHARIDVAEQVEVADSFSTNGVLVAGELVDRSSLDPRTSSRSVAPSCWSWRTAPAAQPAATRSIGRRGSTPSTPAVSSRPLPFRSLPSANSSRGSR